MYQIHLKGQFVKSSSLAEAFGVFQVRATNVGNFVLLSSATSLSWKLNKPALGPWQAFSLLFIGKARTRSKGKPLA
jgi:hypothetical protein